MLGNRFYNIKTKSAPLRLVLFLLCLAMVWLPWVVLIHFAIKDNPNLTTIVIMGLLLFFFLLLQQFWGKYVYQQPSIWEKYGLTNNWLGLIRGLAIGFVFCWSLFFTEAFLGWITISHSSIGLLKIILEGLLSGLGIAFAEELFFRGWILYELEQDYSKNNALWISSFLFAIAHFFKPVGEILRTLVTFPALFLLGLTLVWAKRNYYNNLTISIGIHAGLVWGYYILNVGNLVTYNNQVPHWITGIDGNPIAGILGLSFMSILALVVKKQYLQ